ncbi:GNAT family N-acetyltransferase [Micromonospora palythoicola]|uniref:GNAT family N-acetyltransferase n=1 Tax=Micromonospora palythoicola TaxID=3120507 RepID=UPI002FCE5990
MAATEEALWLPLASGALGILGALAGAGITQRWGFGEFGLHRVYGRCHAGNEASARLMTRLGMRCEARHIESYLFRDEWADRLVFAMLAREWLSRSAALSG